MLRPWLVLLLLVPVGCAQLKPNDDSAHDGGDDVAAGDVSDGSPDVEPDRSALDAPEASPDQSLGSARPDGPTTSDAGEDSSDDRQDPSDAGDASLASEDALDGDASTSDGPVGTPETSNDAEGPSSDAMDAADVAPDAGWTPRSLGGLAIWLKAETGVEVQGDAVTAWADQSPNHHRAIAAFVTQRPTLLPEGIGQHPGVAFGFKGETLIIPDAPSLHFGSKDVVVQLVFRHTTPTIPAATRCTVGYGILYGKALTTRPFRGMALLANFEFYDPAGSTFVPRYGAQLDNSHFVITNDGVTYNDDVPRMFAAFRQANFLTIRVNGSPGSTVEMPPDGLLPANIDALGADVTIGANLYGDQCLRGVISEMIVATDVTLQDLLALDTYLFDKYADVLHPALPR